MRVRSTDGFEGDFVPDALKRKVISEYLNIPEKELWPNV